MTNNESSPQNYRQEIEQALSDNTSRIGDVFRARLEDVDKHPQAIADELGLDAVNSVYSHLRTVQTLVEGRRQTGARAPAAQIASAIRGFVKRHRDLLSTETIARLEALEEDHNRVVKDGEAIARESEHIRQETEDTEAKKIPGIYVYSYPHYMNYYVIPSDEDDTRSRTYLKVGMSGTDAEERAKGQQNLTAVPEPIMLLRIYTHSHGDLKEIENKIHDHLNAADHNQVNKGRRRGCKRESGEEWFLTHLPFMDSTAELLGLDTEYAYEDDYSS